MKINNIKQLQLEKNRISKRCRELENSISAGWKDIKGHLRTAHAAEDNPKANLVKTIFSFALHSIAKKAADKATAKITSLF